MCRYADLAGINTHAWVVSPASGAPTNGAVSAREMAKDAVNCQQSILMATCEEKNKSTKNRIWRHYV